MQSAAKWRKPRKGALTPPERMHVERAEGRRRVPRDGRQALQGLILREVRSQLFKAWKARDGGDALGALKDDFHRFESWTAGSQVHQGVVAESHSRPVEASGKA